MCTVVFFAGMSLGGRLEIDPKDCSHPEEYVKEWCEWCRVHSIDEMHLQCAWCGKILRAEPTLYWKKRGWDRKRLRH